MQASKQLIQHLLDENQSIFTYEDALRYLPTSSELAVRSLLTGMVQRRVLLRIRPGVYQVIPWGADPHQFQPSPWKTARHISPEQHHFALDTAGFVHQLWDDAPEVHHIISCTQTNLRSLEVQGVRWEFYYQHPDRFFGTELVMLDGEEIRVSDLEKTLIDLLSRADLFSSAPKVKEMFARGLPRCDKDKLLRYVRSFQSQAVIKRLGLMAEWIYGQSAWTEELHKLRTHSYTSWPFEMDGGITARWRIHPYEEAELLPDI